MNGIFILTLIFFTSVTANNANDCLAPFCTCDLDLLDLDCANFENFTQLNFKDSKIAWFSVDFRSRSSKEIQLDSKLDLSGLKLNTTGGYIPRVTFDRINGIDIDYNPFKRIEFVGGAQKFSIAFRRSRFWFLSSNAGELCTFSTEKDFVFSGLTLNTFYLYDPDFLSSSEFCPLMFFNTSIENFMMFGPSGKLKFVPVMNATDRQLEINIEKLNIEAGRTNFPKVLTEESILNQALFGSLKSLELRSSTLTYISADDLKALEKLKFLKFKSVGLGKLLQNGTEWMRALNPNLNVNTVTLNQQSFNENAIRMVLAIEEDSFGFEDEDLCLFNGFPQDNLLVPLFEDASRLTCSCTVYWLFKRYNSYKPFLQPDDLPFVPTQCLDINQVLLNEQMQYCDIETRLSECNDTVSTRITPTPATSTIKRTKSCIDDKFKCKCDFDNFNYLECSDPSIQEIPDDLSTKDDILWNYVTFVGSSIESITEFNSLKLDENAVVYVKNISNFGQRLFSKILTNNKFQFIVEGSNTYSLARNLVFMNANLSVLEFADCSFTSYIVLSAFSGADINSLVIRRPRDVSYPFGFRPQPLFEKTVIRKFKIDRAYGAFQFAIDSITLPFNLFNGLEELEISNTEILAIEAITLSDLEKLSTIKLDNVSLTAVLDSETKNGSWLAATQLKRLFLGREYTVGFKFQDEYACYFHQMHNNLKVYIYDSIDIFNGPACTCTFYWFYRNLDFKALENDDYSSYVPKCIKALGTVQRIAEELAKCFNKLNLVDYCKSSETQTTTTTTTEATEPPVVTISSRSTTTTIANTLQTEATEPPTVTVPSTPTTTTASTTTKSTLREDVLFYGFIALAALLLLTLVILLVLCFKISKTRTLFKRLAVSAYPLENFANGKRTTNENSF